MVNDLKDSIKAKLYDFNYTPFMSSFVISWIVINHKYLLVLFSDKIDVDKKLVMLNDVYSYNAVYSFVGFYILPLFFALFYVFGYPCISKIFYEYTLKQTKKLKEIKQKIEDETPITQEEAREIRKQLDKLATERDEAVAKLTNLEKIYDEKLEKELASKTIENVREKNTLQEQLNNEKQSGKQLFINLEKEIDKNKKVEAELQELQKALKDNSAKNEFEDDAMKILRYLYESNYTKNSRGDAIGKIVSVTKMPLIVVEKIIDGLISEGILLQQRDMYGNSIDISKKGREYLMELFYKK